MSAVIFDLDGTLIDSIEDLASCVNQALEEKSFKTHNIDEYKYFIGDGARVLVQRALKDEDVSQELQDEIHDRFQQLYKDKIDSKTKVYEGIYELLDKLEKTKYKKAILSNKPDIFTQACVKKFFKDYSFVNISGQKKEIAKKPSPEAAFKIAKDLEEECANIYFVGDTKVDIQTAKNAGMIAIGVLWGFREEKELRENGADFIVSNTQELYEVLSSQKYLAIPCHFYDEFESAAVKKELCTFIYLNEQGQKQKISSIIKDLKTKNKEEFVILKNDLTIRLDKILEINGKKIEDYKTCNV